MYAGPVGVAEDGGDQVASAAHADLLEDRLQVVLHGEWRQVEFLRDPRRGPAEQHEPRHVSFPRAESVGEDDEFGEFGRARRLNDDCRVGAGAVAELRAVQDEPVAGDGAHSGACRRRVGG